MAKQDFSIVNLGSIKATKLLKEAGLKVVYHLMPGLPGMTPEKDLRDFKRLFEEEDFQVEN